MKSLLRMAVMGAAALLISGCALLPDSPTTTDAKRGVQIAITAYAGIYQPALLAYGRLPVCPNPTPSGSICHDRAVFAKLAATDQATTRSIVAAQAVMKGQPGSLTAISDALTAIQQAQVQIAAAGVLTNKTEN